MALKIIASTCTACSACEPECPNVAIREKGGTYVIDPKKCSIVSFAAYSIMSSGSGRLDQSAL